MPSPRLNVPHAHGMRLRFQEVLAHSTVAASSQSNFTCTGYQQECIAYEYCICNKGFDMNMTTKECHNINECGKAFLVDDSYWTDPFSDLQFLKNIKHAI
eukprot:764091-Hanusia_phi.AAC.1